MLTTDLSALGSLVAKDHSHVALHVRFKVDGDANATVGGEGGEGGEGEVTRKEKSEREKNNKFFILLRSTTIRVSSSHCYSCSEVHHHIEDVCLPELA